MPLYGYARVSTRDQDLAAQDAELRTGADQGVQGEGERCPKTDQPELAKVIRRLEPGDVLVVTRLDRLARSTRDLLNVLDEIKERGAGFVRSRIPGPIRPPQHGKLMLTVLGGLAEFNVADRCPDWRGPRARQGSRRALWPST